MRRNPLLERVKFLAITASNLDEFVEIRVAGILQRIEDGLVASLTPDEGGLTQQERLDRLSEQMNYLRLRAVPLLEQAAAARHGAGRRPCAALERSQRRGAEARAQVLPG